MSREDHCWGVEGSLGQGQTLPVVSAEGPGWFRALIDTMEKEGYGYSTPLDWSSVKTCLPFQSVAKGLDFRWPQKV